MTLPQERAARSLQQRDTSRAAHGIHAREYKMQAVNQHKSLAALRVAAGWVNEPFQDVPILKRVP